MYGSSNVGAVSTTDKLDLSEFQCGYCLLAEYYRLEVASLITQVAGLRKKLGKRRVECSPFLRRCLNGVHACWMHLCLVVIRLAGVNQSLFTRGAIYCLSYPI